MSDPILIPCLVTLRAEFNAIAPERSKASDGWIGDTAHQREVSDHNPDETGSVPIHDADHVNEVHAIDVDSYLRGVQLDYADGGWNFYGMEAVVQFLLGRCRSGAETRLRYIIYNRRIWEASREWKRRDYTGPSAHTEHAHFSASYVTALEASTASWHLEDIPVALTDPDKAAIRAIFKEELQAILATDGVKFTDAQGGTASKIAQAIYNSCQPATRGAKRTPIWGNEADLRTAVDALAPPPEK